MVAERDWERRGGEREKLRDEGGGPRDRERMCEREREREGERE